MTISDIIAVLGIAVTVVIALIGGLYSVLSSTKRFELAEEYKRELFAWYREVMFVIKKLENNPPESENDASLGELSVLIDIGRFYFPNDIKRTPPIGRNRPRIHWGYRQLPLDFLVVIYEISKNGDMDAEKDAVQYLKDEYSSAIFQVISPEERIHYIDRHTEYRSLPKEAIEDYFDKQGAPENIMSVIFHYYR